MKCELCKIICEDQDAFITHCSKDSVHLDLQLKFTDETFDFLFQEQIPELDANPKQQTAQFQSSLVPKKP